MKSGFTDPLFDSLLTLQTAEWFMKARRNAGKPLLLPELKWQKKHCSHCLPLLFNRVTDET